MQPLERQLSKKHFRNENFKAGIVHDDSIHTPKY